GATDSYLDEVVIDNEGGRMWICSDTDYCSRQKAPVPESGALKQDVQNTSGKAI
ncbi:MAG: alpha-D-ribose 1-methylphosphonate 5-phosphate C-P-lyase PhnJ, partial [Cyanobacteria bacterium J06560_2]